MSLTQSILRQIAPAAPKDVSKYVQPLIDTMDHYEINTALRQAMFLSQIAHESQDFNRVEENLHYSAAGLRKTWPTRFNLLSSLRYANKPEKIANRVYADRMDNGSESSGDGWKYRGRGLLMITGKSNYKSVGLGLTVNLVGAPNLLAIPKWATLSAGLFWRRQRLNEVADAKDVARATKIINGGLTGLESRQAYYDRALKALGK